MEACHTDQQPVQSQLWLDQAKELSVVHLFSGTNRLHQISLERLQRGDTSKRRSPLLTKMCYLQALAVGSLQEASVCSQGKCGDRLCGQLCNIRSVENGHIDMHGVSCAKVVNMAYQFPCSCQSLREGDAFVS